MIKLKYREIIFQQTRKRLTLKLHQKVYPATHVSIISQLRSSEPAITEYIKEKIDNIIPQSKLHEFTGSNDQISVYINSETIRLVDELYPDMLYRIVHQLKKVLPALRRELIVDREPFDSCEKHLKYLRCRIETNDIESQSVWSYCMPDEASRLQLCIKFNSKTWSCIKTLFCLSNDGMNRDLC